MLLQQIPFQYFLQKYIIGIYDFPQNISFKSVISDIINFELNFDSNKIAKSIKKATDPENEGWVESIVKDNIIKSKVRAASMGSLKEAAEDFMACVSVAESILKK